MQAVALVESGVPWLDAEVGGLPRPGVVAVRGEPGSGKSALALGYVVSALSNGGKACYLTTDAPNTLLNAADSTYERDLHKHLAARELSILSLGPFFTNKMRSLQSVDAPLAELREFIADRGFQYVVFDTFDAFVGWVDPSNAKALATRIVDELRTWQVSVLCTLGGEGPQVSELARAADGSFEIHPDRFVVRHAKWCNAKGIETPMQLVQGRGFVASEALEIRGGGVSGVTTIRPGPLPQRVAEAQSLSLVQAPPEPTIVLESTVQRTERPSRGPRQRESTLPPPTGQGVSFPHTLRPPRVPSFDDGSSEDDVPKTAEPQRR